MRKTRRNLGLLSLAVTAALSVSAAPAGADCAGMREFRGKILSFESTGKGAGLTVRNRDGDKVSFQKAEHVEVVDRRGGAKPATEWKGLNEDMYVSVCWSFDDTPPRAYKVTVRAKPD